MTFILASSSPRRLQLLEQIGIIPDQIVSPDVDESELKSELPRLYVARIARLKMDAIPQSDAWALTADTTVATGRRILGKSPDADHARGVLKHLSGRRHRVYTSICLRDPQGKITTRTTMTHLAFKHLDKAEIEAYLVSGEWQGVAGAYKIQGHAGSFIKSINGSYTGVVGLPLYETTNLLKGAGFYG